MNPLAAAVKAGADEVGMSSNSNTKTYVKEVSKLGSDKIMTPIGA